jgi:hypothetical protein
VTSYNDNDRLGLSDKREADYSTTGAGNPAIGPDGWFAGEPAGRTDRPAWAGAQAQSTAFSGGGTAGAREPKHRAGRGWLRRHWLALVLVLVALFVGVGIGSGSPQTVAGPERIVNVPGPERVVNHDVPGPERVVEKSPKSCLLALDLADTGFGYSQDAMTIVAAAFEAISNGDVEGLTTETGKLKGVSDKFTVLAPKYNAAKAECRAGG